MSHDDLVSPTVFGKHTVTGQYTIHDEQLYLMDNYLKLPGDMMAVMPFAWASAIPFIPGTLVMDGARMAVERLGRKSFDQLRKEEKDPALEEIANIVAANKKTALEKINAKPDGKEKTEELERLEKTDKEFKVAFGRANSEIAYAGTIVEAGLKRQYVLTQSLLKEKDGESKVDDHPVIKDTKEQNKTNLDNLQHAIHHIFNTEVEYANEYKILLGESRPHLIIPDKLRDRLQTKVEADHKSQSQVYIPDARGYNPSVQEQAREAVGDTRLKEAPDGVVATNVSDPQRVAKEAKGRK